MIEENDRNLETRRRRTGINKGQKIVLVVAGTLGACLILAALLGGVQIQRPSLSSSLKLLPGIIESDRKTGKLRWVGSVLNPSGEMVTAPWVKVTIFNPAGEPVDSNEATPGTTTMAGGTRLGYVAEFDTRGAPSMRAVPVLEYPNSKDLGL